MADKMRVLLVDDEEEYLSAMARVLGRRGLDITTEQGGEAALKRLSSASFDVIVLDLRMPGMDGLVTLQRIREGDRRTPVLLVSGQGDFTSINQALKQGIADFLVKPCPVETMVSAIEDAYERSVLAAAVRSLPRSK